MEDSDDAEILKLYLLVSKGLHEMLHTYHYLFSASTAPGGFSINFVNFTFQMYSLCSTQTPFLFFFLLFICAYNVWVISPPSPHHLPYLPGPLPLLPYPLAIRQKLFFSYL
jgi:hypothetical protein